MAKKKKDKPPYIKPNTSTLLPFEEYDQVIVSFSGGKDSLACVLHLLESGVPPEKIELWHQAVDGRPGVAARFFDWPVTEAYCNAAAAALGIPIRYQWRENGFLGTMLKGEPQPDGPFVLHSSAITAYFRFDDDGTIWPTRNYYNCTLFDTMDEAEAWKASLPPEGTAMEQFLTQADLDKIGKKLEKKREKIKEKKKDLTARQYQKKLEEADEWYANRIGPMAMPPLAFVNVTTPRTKELVGFELYQGGLADGAIGSGSGGGDPGVRLQFPAPVPDLGPRWCSAELKIDVARIAVNNDPTYAEGTFLFITGERRQESENRMHYAAIEKFKRTQTTRVDHWRPVLEWDEQHVWDIVARWRIRPHPGYYLGWGRLSCLSCIFGDVDQWASVQQISPDLFNTILHYERRFGKSIQEGGDVSYLASKGKSFVPDAPDLVALAMGNELGVEYATLAEGEEWVMPSGAFKRSGGPL